MTPTKKDLARQWLSPKKIAIVSLGLFFCLANTANGLADERARAIANVKQIKAQAKVSPQQRMQAVQQYVHRLSEPELLKLSQEIGGERFLRKDPSATPAGKMNQAGKMNAREKMRQEAKMHAMAKTDPAAKMQGVAKSGAEKGIRGADPQTLQKQEIQATLRSPLTRERYLNAVANYLLNTTK
jgi:hypothetical protein